MNNEKWGLDLPTQFWLATNRKCQSIANTKTGKGHFPRGWIELEEEEVSSAQRSKQIYVGCVETGC
jgi:hypothetical protein